MEGSKNKHKKYDKWVLGIYIAICISLGFCIEHTVREMTGQYKESQMQVMAGLLAEKVSTSVDHIVDSAKQTASLLSLHENRSAETLYQEIQKFEEHSLFTDMGLFSSPDDFFGSPGVQRDFEKYRHFDKVLEAKDTYITEPYRSSVTAKYMISIMIPLSSSDEEKYIMYASFPLETIQGLAQTESLYSQPEIALLNADSGNYIACTDGEMASAGSWNNLMLMHSQMEFENETFYHDYMQNLEHRTDSGIAQFDFRDKAYTQGYVRIQSMPDWYIAVNLPNSTLSGFLMQHQTRIAGYFAAIIILTLCLCIWIICRQILQKKKLQQLSENDPLLGILNKRTFISRFHDYIAKQNQSPCGVLIFLDVDDFKIYNDTYGHLSGDLVLKQFAKTMMAFFGENGLVGRYGGDEFILFLKGFRKRESVEKSMLRLQQELHEMELPDHGIVKLSFSAGLARFPDSGKTFEELCNHADKALYRVKSHGKNAFAWYE